MLRLCKMFFQNLENTEKFIRSTVKEVLAENNGIYCTDDEKVQELYDIIQDVFKEISESENVPFA